MMSAILEPFGPVDHGNADVAGLPRLDRHPGMHLAVIERQRALVVDQDAGVVGVAAGIALHDGEAAPDAVVDAGLPERRDLRPVERAHDRGVGVHREPVQGVFGKHHEVHGRQVAPRLADHRDDARGLRREIVGRRDHRQLQLHHPQHDAVGGFVEAAEPAHCDCPSRYRHRWSAVRRVARSIDPTRRAPAYPRRERAVTW